MKNKAYIDEIETNIKGEIFIRLINGKKWHKLTLYNSPNICGFYCKGGNHIFSNHENIDDFSRILEAIMNLPIGYDLYERIKRQVHDMGYYTSTARFNF